MMNLQFSLQFGNKSRHLLVMPFLKSYCNSLHVIVGYYDTFSTNKWNFKLFFSYFNILSFLTAQPDKHKPFFYKKLWIAYSPGKTWTRARQVTIFTQEEINVFL